LRDRSEPAHQCQAAAAPISWLSTAVFSRPSQADAREFLRPAPRRPPRPERVCRRCGNEDTSSEDDHMIASDDKVGPPTSLGLQCRGQCLCQIVGLIVGSSKVEERPDRWLASDCAPRAVVGRVGAIRPSCRVDTSCRPIRTTRRSATSRSAQTRRLSASRRPVSMTAIVNTSDTASPRVARWSASVAHFGVAKCPQGVGLRTLPVPLLAALPPRTGFGLRQPWSSSSVGLLRRWTPGSPLRAIASVRAGQRRAAARQEHGHLHQSDNVPQTDRARRARCQRDH
jgi:hypothetical protein